jgi:predicted amidohydrolase YtcJ
VLDRDIMHVTDADLRDARVLQTVLGGKVVYTRK